MRQANHICIPGPQGHFQEVFFKIAILKTPKSSRGNILDGSALSKLAGKACTFNENSTLPLMQYKKFLRNVQSKCCLAQLWNFGIS